MYTVGLCKIKMCSGKSYGSDKISFDKDKAFDCWVRVEQTAEK